MNPRQLIAPAVLALVFVGAWEIFCFTLNVRTYLLPRPSMISSELLAAPGSLAWHAGVTLAEALLGFVVANVVAILLAMLMTYVRGIEKAIMPFAIALKTTPVVAMAPLLLLWLGTGIAPKVAASALICFFPALVSTLKGFHALAEGEEDLFRVYGATNTQILTKLRIYRAAPFLFSGLKISSSLSIVGAIVGEFVGANQGIGYVILVSSYHLETPRMFAGLIVSAVAGVAFYSLISYLDRRVVFWAPEVYEDVRLESARGRRSQS